MNISLKEILFSLLLFLATTVSGQFLYNFSHLAKVEIKGNGDVGSVALEDFPFYFEYQSDNLRTKSNGGLVDSDEGMDIWFGTADGTILYSEIEEYNPSTGSLAAWIRLPSYEPNIGTGFYIHIGNPLVEYRPGSSFVWSEEFVGVWHMNGNAEDASGNANNGSMYGATSATGVSGGALNFDGINDSLLVPNSPSLNLSEQVSIEAWIMVDGEDDAKWVVAGKYLDYWFSCNNETLSFWAGETNLDMGTEFEDGTWYHIVGTYDRSVMRLYVDGTEMATMANTTAISNDGSKPFTIAYYPQEPGAWNFEGRIDELRLYNEALDASWIKESYRNLNNPSGIISVSEFLSSNNQPCRAIQLDTEADLNQIPFSNYLATASGNPLTECEGYSGNDVWFRVEAPDNGKLNIKLSTDPIAQIPSAAQWIQRSGLAVYSDTCNSLNYLSCWIDEVVSAPHIQPEIELLDLEPGEDLYLRVWGYGGERGFFSIEFQSEEEAEIYQLSGSASYCEDEAGKEITLSGSENGFLYQLKRNGLDLGTTVSGDGNALSWNGLEEGVYEVVAKVDPENPGIKMEGKAIINKKPLPVTNHGYSYEMSLTIESDSVYGTADLVDFPVLIKIDSVPELAVTASGGHVQHSLGYDIAFSDENFNPLPFELTNYDTITGSIEAWVKVPILSPANDTELHILYGNSSISTNLSSADVWSQNYKQVLHLDEDISDATGKGNYGLGESLLQMNGKISSCRSFDGIDDMLIVQNDTSLEESSTLSTLSLWINFDNPAEGTPQLILCDEDRYSVGQGYEWAVQANGDHFFYPNGNHTMNYNQGPDPFASGQWHYLVTTLQYQSKEVSIYIDGKQLSWLEENIPTYWSDAATFSSWLWGGNPDRESRYFAGKMDEIRIQNLVRSQSWIQTEFSNQNTPKAFITLSEEREYKPMAALCSSASAISLVQPLPLGGVFSGNGLSGLSFDPSIAGSGDQELTYEFTGINGCTSQNTSSILVIASPTPLISGEEIVQENSTSIVYSTTHTDGNTYAWELIADGAQIASGQGENSILVNWGLSSGVLSLTESDSAGCVGESADFDVFVSKDSIPEDGIIIPEVFTPNMDGWNDRFEIIGLNEYPGNILSIYNVNGIKIFEMSDYDSSWDGTSVAGSSSGNKLPSGTYYYVLKITSEKTLKGFIYLRRE